MNSATRALATGALLTLGSLAACGGERGETSGAAVENTGNEAPTEITAEARQEAQQIYSTRCTVCHGTEGRGDGPGGASLDPAPRDYHDATWQDSVTNQEIERAIVYGGAAVGRSPAMVANPDLGSKPDVVAALREIIRNFGNQR